MEFHGQFCFAKGGLAYADMVTTVSPTYAQEVLTPAYGHGLEGHMQYLARLGRLRGIVNGIDTGAFDPATDPAIAAPYDLARPAGKRRCKAVLQADCRLPDAPDVAVLGMVSRIADQKGFDLLVAAARDLIALPAQIVVLGAGDELLSRQLSDLESAFPRAVRVHIGFDSYLAQRIYAGADMFLMPSRFEPCGLGQLIALRYGTIPVVRGTGGLKDTVHDADECPTSGNGFVFSELTAASLVAAARRAIAAYRDRGRWQSLVVRALREDHSWDRSAREYAELYTQLVAGTSGVRPPTRASSSA
jgi:starch synthase